MGATLVINASGVETRVALVEDGTISEYYLERKKDKGIVGNIYKGKVVRVLPGMQAAFVDIGLDKAAFLYVNDVFYDPEFSEQQFELTEGEHAEYDDPGEHEAGCRCSECANRNTEEVTPSDSATDESEAAKKSDGEEAEGDKDKSVSEVDSGERKGELRAGHGRRNRRGRNAHRDARISDDAKAASAVGDGNETAQSEKSEGAESSVAMASTETTTVPATESTASARVEAPSESTDVIISSDSSDVDIPAGAAELTLPPSSVDSASDFSIDSAAVEITDAISSSVASNGSQLIEKIDKIPLTKSNEPLAATTTETASESAEISKAVEAIADDADSNPDSIPTAIESESASAPKHDDAIAGGTEIVQAIVETTPANDDDAEKETPIAVAITEELSPVAPTATADDSADNKETSDTETDDATETKGEKIADVAKDENNSSSAEAVAEDENNSSSAEAVTESDQEITDEEATEVPPAASTVEEDDKPVVDRPKERKGRNHKTERGHKGGKDIKTDEEKSDAMVTGNRQGGAKQRRPAANIQDLLKVGQEIIVQVAKDPIGTKGARVTSHISIPGRQIVFMPTVDHVGISRRIEKESERRRLRDIVERIRPAGTGFIVRTVAENISTEKLEADARFLTGIWSEVVAKKDKIAAPALLHPDLDLTLRATRDLFVQDVEKLVIDDRAEWERISRFVAAQAPALKDRVVLHDGDEPIFDAYGIEHELQRAYSRKVWLKSGGYLIIDQAEALTAIDVNSGRYVGKKSLEETITKINIEAAKEIVYQLRLRNIGGIMIIDFIDMAKAQNRDKVFKALQEALGHDKARTNILKISELGLIEMTRKRVRESVGRTMNEPCPYCEGRGFLKSRTTVAYDILRQIRREANNFGECSIHVNCNPEVAHLLQYDEREELRYLMDRFNKSIHIHAQPGYHQEQYEVYGKLDRTQRNGRPNEQKRTGTAIGTNLRRNGTGNDKGEDLKFTSSPAALKPPEHSGELRPATAPLEAPQGKLSEYK